MKKTLLLFAMLLSVVGAWAEVTKPVSGVYVISGDNPAGKRGNLAAVEGITEHPALSNITWDTYKNNSVTPITNGEHWYVYQVGDKYVIYNLGLKKYLVNPKSGSSINFDDTPYLWDILVNSTNNNFNSIWDATGTYLCFACGKNAASRNVHFNNEAGDGGSLHTFTAVENGETTYAEDIAVVVSKMNPTFTLTDIAGNEYTGTYSGIAGVDEPTFTGAANITISNKQWNGDNFTADITFPFSVSSARVTNPTMISSFGSANYGTSNYKWYADGVNIRNKKATSATNANVLSHMWAIYPSINNGKIVYTIKNLQTGTYVYSKSSSNSHGDGVVTLSETASVLTFEENKFKLSTGKYLSNNSSTGANGRLQTIGTWDSHDGCLLSFPAVTYEVNVGAAGYASLYTPIAGTLTGTARMITSEDIQDGYVTFGDVETNVSTPIPANQGAIVIGEGTYTFTAGDVTADWSANLLKGSAVNTYVKDDAYVLSAPDGVKSVGLYKALLNKNENGETGDTHFKNNAGKAYLPASDLSAEAAESRFFLFGFGDGEETGITETENGNVKTENTVVYDLAGRRVQGAQKGIFIVNGKKVVR